MRLFNIGAEGQLYLGAIGAAGIALYLADQPTAGDRAGDDRRRRGGGAAWAAIPGLLRAFAHTNEIITSLMLNYCAALLLNYLIFDSQSYWRDDSATGQLFPQGKTLADAAAWPVWTVGSVAIPFGFVLGVAVAVVVWVLYARTRFGFEAQVIADSPRAARYAGMRTRRKIVAVLCLSGAIAGIGGASQMGDFRHVLDARGLQQANYGYTGIVVAALARYNPFAVVLVAFLMGGLENAGYTLQGADFPSGLVGRDAGDHPVRDARRRAPRPLPHRDRPSAAHVGGGGRRRRRERRHRRGRPRRRGRLRDAAPLRRARRAARRALGRPEPRRRGDDAPRRGLRLPLRPARRRLGGGRAAGRGRRRRAGRRRRVR